MRAIIFDIDGTLVESMSVDTELYFAAIREVLGQVRIRDSLSDYRHVTDSGILAQLMDDNGLSPDDEILEQVRTAFVGGLRRHIETDGPFSVIDGAVQFFENVCSRSDCRVAIATGGWRASALLKLESAGFPIEGVPLATSDDSASRVEIMRSALDRAGGDTGVVTYFGDAEWDRRACNDLGWEFVAVGPDLGGIESYVDVRL